MTPMDDYISRAAVLALQQVFHTDKYGERAVLVDDIKQLPAAEVEPVRHGRWVTARNQYGQNRLLCSACGKHSGLLRKKPRCPNCGAKMNEKEEADHE